MSTSQTGLVHKVDVGEHGLLFDPASLSASVGDTVEFHFYPQNHSVAQASFDNACHPLNSSGFFSGFVPTSEESKTVFTLTINNTDPIWYYCGQEGHCQAGMVGVINPPSGGNNLSSFKISASGTTDTTVPDNVQGGVLAASGSGSESSSTASSSSGTTQTASSTTASSTNVASKTGAAASISIFLVLFSLASMFML
ncbi:cupredoxin [Penicillium herquei]|nr:cupredoxin [Penicillium herquei]